MVDVNLGLPLSKISLKVPCWFWRQIIQIDALEKSSVLLCEDHSELNNITKQPGLGSFEEYFKNTDCKYSTFWGRI